MEYFQATSAVVANDAEKGNRFKMMPPVCCFILTGAICSHGQAHIVLKIRFLECHQDCAVKMRRYDPEYFA